MARALSYIEGETLTALSRGPLTSVGVAEFLWPLSDGWRRPHGRGVQGLARCASRILRRLERLELVHVRYEKPTVWVRGKR